MTQTVFDLGKTHPSHWKLSCALHGKANDTEQIFHGPMGPIQWIWSVFLESEIHIHVSDAIHVYIRSMFYFWLNNFLITQQHYKHNRYNHNACQVYSVRFVSKIKSILSVIFYAMCFQPTHLLFGWSWECWYLISLLSSIQNMNH